ncbi:dihydrodipicolinate synthase family protein [Mucilaginibacter sp. HMF5004]|uniref:dihydrodipicolinate synthase family protein n=1 Tax=Mucilaginibacter rivuli TaxID=2857527 RepID=UPI001C5E9858|nr:dihydrodipicolinate synthase family protein [Mucilaginibacter rivuli]MBW4889001.1 dihydrodipicolinate synthase family protein [Mucilaginibacter rivuli]
MKKKYSGIIIPTITPLTERFELDKAGVKNMFTNFRANEVKPFILGTTGESASLPNDLKRDYIKLAGELKQGTDQVYVGIASNRFEESVALAKYAFDNGADAVAAHLPYYYKLSESQIKTYFEQLADKCGGPLIVYNIPATTHMSLPLNLINELSQHPNIVGVKDSEQNEDRVRDSIELWKEREDFSYFLGWAARSALALLNGSDGLIPSSGNLFPGIYNDMAQAAKLNNVEAVNALQRKSDLVGKLYQSGRLLGESLWALKVLMFNSGICQSHVMPPLRPQSAEEEANLAKGLYELMKSEGLEVKIDICD